MLKLIAKAPREKQDNYYTPEPEPWIEENFLTSEDDVVISIKRATADKSEYFDYKQEYHTDEG